MLILVSLTGGAGFLTSFTLLHSGFDAMGPRYLVSCLVAYMAFLLLLWLWLKSQLSELVDSMDALGSPGSSAHGDVRGGGGHFGGGGASGTFDTPADHGIVDDAVSAVASAEELAIPVVVVIVGIAVLASTLFVVYSAPVLFAELLLDSLLAAGLYRRLRKINHSHWLQTAVQRTVWPFVLTALSLTVAGWAMSHFAPNAHSMGEAIRIAKETR